MPLAQKIGLSLPTIKSLNRWTPLEETSLVAWWQFAMGITDSGATAYKVSKWDDSSTNNNHLIQSVLTEQPTNGNTSATKGTITFNSSDSQNMDTTSQISLADDFTIGVALNLAAGGGILLGDNTINGEFFRFFSTTKIRIKIDNATAVDIEKDSGTFLGKAYLVLTRVSDVITLHWNGVAQTDTETLSGTADIDNLGVRNSDLNPYDGTIQEVQIYSSANDDLTAEVNARLSMI